MAANPVQTAAAAHTTGTTTITFPAAPLGNDLVTVLIGLGAGTATVSSITGLGASWSLIADSGSQVSGTRALIYAAIVPNGNSGTSVAVAPSTAGCTVSGQEWSGYGLKLDGTNSGKTNGVTSQGSGSITTTVNNDLVIAFAERSNTTAWTGPGAPWNTIDNFVTASPSLNSVWQTANAGTFNPSWSWTTVANAAAAIAAFQSSAALPLAVFSRHRAARVRPKATRTRSPGLGAALGRAVTSPLPLKARPKARRPRTIIQRAKPRHAVRLIGQPPTVVAPPLILPLPLRGYRRRPKPTAAKVRHHQGLRLTGVATIATPQPILSAHRVRRARPSWPRKQRGGRILTLPALVPALLPVLIARHRHKPPIVLGRVVARRRGNDIVILIQPPGVTPGGTEAIVIWRNRGGF